MKRIYLMTFFLFTLGGTSFAKYVTPGTGITFSLDDLVLSSNGAITQSGADYLVNDTITISASDILLIQSNAILKFAKDSYIEINGTLTINPPDSVKFTAIDPLQGYLGVWLNGTLNSEIKHLVMEYGVSMKLSDAFATFENCTFRNNNNSASTSFGNGAISLFRSSPVIKNSFFLNNHRAAIQAGANVNCAPQIIGNYFEGNNTDDKNVPQINLGATGLDTARIIGNKILRASTNSGGISFLPIGDAAAIISNNEIKNNRYGINLQGGSNLFAIVSDNQIDSNNTQGNPNLGGSGIAFVGGSASSHQISIVRGNTFTANLWGITIQTHATPNIGNLDNTDPSDNGGNRFINNTNSGVPGIDLYNNTVYPIYAQGNYWNTNIASEVADKIFDGSDNASLGQVIYNGFILPVSLSSFAARIQGSVVNLSWTTASESNSSHFEILRSTDGIHFSKIGTVNAAGHSAQEIEYAFSDKYLSALSGEIFYRLKLVDADDHFSYSRIVSVKLNDVPKEGLIKLYPTAFRSAQNLTAIVATAHPETMEIQVIGNNGRILRIAHYQLLAGVNTITIPIDASVPSGTLLIRMRAKGFVSTKQVIKQ